MTVDIDFELEIDRRIAACKTQHPEWLEYNEESAMSTLKQDDASYKLEKTRFLCRHLAKGFLVSSDLRGSLLYVGEDHTVKPLYQNEMPSDSLAWLLEQQNVRRAYAIGYRCSFVVHTNGTVSHVVIYSKSETGAAIRYAKTLEVNMRAMDGWKDISDIVSTSDEVVALTASGTLNIIRTDPKSFWDNTGWANRASDVAVLGCVDAQSWNLFYINSQGVICPSKGPTASWFDLANQVYAGKGILAVGENFAACLNDEGELKLSYRTEKTALSIENWPKLVHILSWEETLVGLAKNGVVYATGEKSHLFDGWSNIAFLTSNDEYSIFGIRWDGSCVCTDKDIDLSKADFSWLLDKDFNLQKWMGKI